MNTAIVRCGSLLRRCDGLFRQIERQMLRERTASAMQMAIIPGKVSEADSMTLTDFNASFPARIAGRCMLIRTGRGQGQRRIIQSVTEQTLRIAEPWQIVPDATSTYRVLKRLGTLLNGKAPPGYRLEGKPGSRRLVLDEHEAEIIARIVRMREQDNCTYGAIYWALRREDIRTRDGKEWTISRIYQVCKTHRD